MPGLAEPVHRSEAALTLLRRRLAGEWIGVTEENRPIYRELVEAGLMYPVHTLVNGTDGYYRPTDAACELRGTLTASSPSIQLPLPAISASTDG